ncbi:MAG: glucose-6-phosphate isomerase [Syntrophales bacterium]
MSIQRATIRTANCQAAAAEALRALAAGRFMERILRKDHTLWKPEPKEIADRLGWLDSAVTMQRNLSAIGGFVDGVRADGYTFALLMGMGGSSLAPEVFRKVFGRREGFPDLAVIDSTDPGAVLARAAGLDLKRTLFIVSTKSGGTVETFSFLKYFYNLAAGRLGAAEAGRHFVAITDPGSALADIAAVHEFRHCFLNDPEIGGRYSALSLFGLVPAALIGMDLEGFLARAAATADAETASPAAGQEQSGAFLGALLGELAVQGHDKLTFLFSPAIAPFGDWVEQLIAESTGKEGTGILPVLGEPLGPPTAYGADRVFVAVRVGSDRIGEEELRVLARAGHPVVEVGMAEPFDLGAQCFLWEMATAAAGWRLAINPFDQPDVEAAKVLARRMIAAYRETGTIPPEQPTGEAEGIAVYGAAEPSEPAAALDAFLTQAGEGAYAAIQAYLNPSPEIGAALEGFRVRLRERSGLPVTLGYGPRFLHSTGQLHKGDRGRGLFIQLTADDPADAAIPDELGRPGSSLTFGILKAAQASGDRQALRDKGRRVIRFHLRADPAGGINRLG